MKKSFSVVLVVAIVQLVLTSQSIADPIHDAASAGETEEVLRLIAEDPANRDALDQSGRTPLHCAAWKGDLATVQALLAHKANIHATERFNETPLHLASRRGDFKIVSALITAGANVNATDRYNGTPLDDAADMGHTDSAQALINAGADANARDNWGETPLHFAAFKGHVETLQVLIANGANVNVSNSESKTPLQVATEKDHATTVEALQPEAIAKTHIQTALAHSLAAGKAHAARSYTWAAETLPGTEVAKVSHTRAAENHLESENYEAALESYTLAGILPADIHTLVAEYLSTNPHGLGNEAVADRHVRAMLSHMSAADIHHAGGNNAGVESALASAELSRAQAMASYDQAAVNADEEIQRTEMIPAAKLVLAHDAMAAGNHSFAQKALRQRTHSLVFKAAQVVRARRIGSKLETLNSGYAERLTRLGRH